ncbi:MAG: anion transporter [SAR202 cluster bacterium]|nr:anion transporter [SAR202 cluster bacterium]
MAAAILILVFTYLGIIFTRLPRINFDRTIAAMAGAILMIVAGVLTFSEAVGAVNFDTLALLLGMMLLIVVLQRAGLFGLLASQSVAVATNPWRLLVAVVAVTAVCSAFLVNDVVVLLFTPVIIQACRMMRVNPVPYLVAEAMASNIGSTATIVGNPQNAIIGVTSGISFTRFFLYLAPVAAVSTAILLAVVFLFYRGKLKVSDSQPIAVPAVGGASPDDPEPQIGVKVDRSLLYRTAPILALTIAGFFLSSVIDVDVTVVALAGGAAAVLISGIRPSDAVRSVDWPLLVFFGGLFVVVGGAREAGVLDFFLDRVSLEPDASGIVSMHIFSTVVSQVVSNVPLTVITIPVIENVPGDALWISLAAGSTLGGNATLIGAVANIIVAEQAYRQGVEVKFGEFARVGVVVTALTVAASMGILILERELGLLR